MNIGTVSVNTKYKVDSSIYNQIPNSGTVDKTQANASVTPDSESNNTNDTPTKTGWSIGTKIIVATGVTIVISGIVYMAFTPSKKSKKRKK